MRTECKHYESRTYPSGDTVRKCNLNLAPEAPWRCPENCSAFTPRFADLGWSWGDLNRQPPLAEPPNLDEAAAALLGQAQDIVNAAGPEILEEFRRLGNERRPGGGWRGRLERFRRRR